MMFAAAPMPARCLFDAYLLGRLMAYERHSGWRWL